jgi:hypothetical protein
MVRQRPFAPAGSRRRGNTLIEVLIVVTGVAAMLGMCAIMIQLLFHLTSDAQARTSAVTTLGRLARQMRQDVHACESAQISEKPPGKPTGLKLTPAPKHVVAYERETAGVTRIESQDGKIIRRESYALPGAASAGFELRQEGPNRVVVLVVSRSGAPSQIDPPRPMEVVALLGKDRKAPRGQIGSERK